MAAWSGIPPMSHDPLETIVHRAQDGAPLGAEAVPNIGNALWIDVGSGTQEIDSPPQVDHGLDERLVIPLRIFHLLERFAPRRGPNPRIINQERHCPRAGRER